jgi:transcriptional regulator with XRE-family HTH domain
MDKKSLGNMLKKARLNKGYTQEVLAEKSNIGLMYYGEIERGVKMPSTKTLIKIVEALEVSLDYILQNEVSSGKEYVFDELTRKLENLTPQQRKTASDILDAYIQNL